MTSNTTTTTIANTITTNKKSLFAPTFLFISICILIAGVVGIQIVDRIFIGSHYITFVRMYCIAFILQILIILFLILSFSNVKALKGPQGPQGNKGDQGYSGPNGGINVCNKNAYQTIEEKKAFEKSLNYLDLKNPLISDA